MNYMRVNPLLCDGFLNSNLEYDGQADTEEKTWGLQSSHVFLTASFDAIELKLDLAQYLEIRPQHLTIVSL